MITRYYAKKAQQQVMQGSHFLKGGLSMVTRYYAKKAQKQVMQGSHFLKGDLEASKTRLVIMLRKRRNKLFKARWQMQAK